MEAFCKTFEFSSFDTDKGELEKVYKSWGLNFFARKGIMAASTPLFRIKQSSKDATQYFIISRSARSGLTSFRNCDGPMKLDEECTISRRDGNQFKTTLKLTGDNILEQTMVHEKNEIPTMVITRELIEDGKLMLTETCEGNSAARIYAPAEQVESKEDEEL